LDSVISQPVQMGKDKDWAAIADAFETSVGAKSDGSIWRWRRIYAANTNGGWRPTHVREPEHWLAGPGGPPLSLSVSEFAPAAVAVINADGTLWLGGDVKWSRLIKAAQIERAAHELVQVGHDSDWREVKFIAWGRMIAIKRDGSLWEWDGTWPSPGVDSVVPPTRPSLYSDWITACADQRAFLALARDGSLCVWGDPNDSGYRGFGTPDPRRLLLPSRIQARKIAQFSR
jgi:hypothetical protein